MRKLTKRNYLGEGFVHQFIHNQTGEVKFVPCTKAEYERMGVAGGSKHNPTLEGYTWDCSIGGTYKVDSEDTIMRGGEYCIIDKKAHILNPHKPVGERLTVVDETYVVNNQIPDELWQ